MCEVTDVAKGGNLQDLFLAIGLAMGREIQPIVFLKLKILDAESAVLYYLSKCKPEVVSLILGFCNISDDTLNRDPISV